VSLHDLEDRIVVFRRLERGNIRKTDDCEIAVKCGVFVLAELSGAGKV
jgi:hypothetical protein